MEKIKFNDLNQTVIPPGYRWCGSCEALTPHSGNDRWGNYKCLVCDCSSYSRIACPKCGCEEKNDYSEPLQVTRHHNGCHEETEEYKLKKWTESYAQSDKVFREFKDNFMLKSGAPDRGWYCLPDDEKWYNKNKALHKILKDYKDKTKCDCPTYTIYSTINQICTDGGSYYAGETVHWWEYKVRCPVCGFVYENGDST